MLIEEVVFNFQEVGEKSFEDVKFVCLSNFASRLKEALTSNDPKIRNFWRDTSTTNDGRVVEGSLANYSIFKSLFGSKIKYNSKSIVLETTITSNPNNPWNVVNTCRDMYGLEYVEPSENQSGYFRYRKDSLTLVGASCCESSSEKRPDAEERLRNFYTAFTKGEFPFITVTIIRLGNKDHFFYTIHR